ncbi:MerR family transcriptional regulator [Acidithiobacillus thiooxidans]|uniref:MerR family transcriptional regulator n=1 Tax=Acidithiobacillus thiooxidans TaxID=930 RepID=UPI001C068996|nr:MerR family DNA-binding transcriptional regulator [Acidithiobacillus thiooxidans]
MIKREAEYLHIADAAKKLGVSTDTLRRWEREGKILPDRRTMGGWRLYSLETVEGIKKLGGAIRG